MFLKTFVLCALNYVNLTHLILFLYKDWQTALKKTNVKLELLTDIDVVNRRNRY